MEPWPSCPQWLLGAPPQEIGDVRFAKGLVRRNGQLILVVPLSRQEAEERHRDVEDYVFATRLPNGLLVLLEWGGLDRNDPQRSGYSMRSYPRGPKLRLHGAQVWVDAWINRDPNGMLQVVILTVYADASRLVWDWSFLRRDKEKR